MELLSALLVLASSGQTQTLSQNANVYVPECSIARPQDLGKRAHTNYALWFGPNQRPTDAQRPGPNAWMTSGPVGGFTPAELRGAYGDTSTGKGIVAIVVAYDDPSALNDFNVFSAQFGLPTESSTNQTLSTNKMFQVVYGSGVQPATDSTGGWENEACIDFQMAHAMAPGAKIVLVEAADNSFEALFAAVDKAVSIGAKEVSMSWLGNEFVGEASFDVHFGIRDVSFFGASGDAGGVVGYPSASPDVISCGGTSLFLNSDGSYNSERAWNGGGGGPSSQEPIPSYQVGLQSYDANGNHVPITGRATPDIAAVGDFTTGVAIYNSFSGGGWFVAGGTSVATPICAGLLNASETIHRSSAWFWMYDNSGLFRDITTGNNGFAAGVGYDYCTGLGTPRQANSL
jgi:subtilase family serine protease